MVSEQDKLSCHSAAKFPLFLLEQVWAKVDPGSCDMISALRYWIIYVSYNIHFPNSTHVFYKLFLMDKIIILDSSMYFWLRFF